MARALAITVAVLMLGMSFVGATAIAQDQGQQNQQDRGEDRRPDQPMSPEERRQWVQEKRQQAMDRAERAGLFGAPTYQDGSFDGSFVTSTLDEETATVSDHTVARNGSDTVVLAEATVDAPANGSAKAHGATLHLPLEDATLRLFDNPTAQLQFQAREPLNATFTVADGYNASLNENATRASLDGPLDASIVLAADGELSVDGDTVTAQVDEAGAVLFKVRPEDPGEQARERALDHAADEGRLGGEVKVAGASGQAVDQNVSVDVEMRAQYATDGQAIVETDGDVDEGRVLHMAIAKDNLNVSHPQDVAPKVDRDSVAKVKSIDDVVNATADEPLAHVAVRDKVVEVTLWMPDFSLHSVNVQDATQDVPDLPEPIDAPNPSGLSISMAEQARQRALAQQQAWNQLPADAQAQATAQGEAAGLFGQASLELGNLQGTNVRGSVQADSGVIQDYALQRGETPSVLFEEVRPESFTPAEDPAKMGPAVALLGDEVAITAHDTPTANLEVEAGSSSVVVELTTPADGEIDRVSERVLEVTTPMGLPAHVVLAAGNGDLIVEGDTIVANLGANAAVHAVATPGSDVPAAANADERVRANARGDLGAQLSMTAVEAGPVEDRIETGVELTTTDVSDGSVTVQASSENPDARAVALHLDPAVVDDAPPEELTVLLDGEEIPAAANASAALEASGAQASYHIEQAGDGLQVLVNVDGFSDHDLTVQSDSTDDGSGGNDTDDGSTDGTDGGTDGGTEDTPSVGALIAVGVVAAVAAIRRRS